MASGRPTMQARDSSGRQVSLLNDEPCLSCGSRSNSYASESSSPKTPDLRRSHSYDSRTSNPSSPLTPSSIGYGRPCFYVIRYADLSQREKHFDPTSIYSDYDPTSITELRPPYIERIPSKYDEQQEAISKRYPCRFKDSHGCEKSFTTSGHASRHSKIHTAEKAVHCSFQDCHKKFTRADNMKQHLEIHYKERSRSSTSYRSSLAPATKLTAPAGVRKSSAKGARNSRPPSRTGWPEQLSVDTTGALHRYHGDGYFNAPSYEPESPATSPKSGYGPLNMDSFQNALPAQYPQVTPRAAVSRNSNGLDALAAAVASQSGK